MKSLLLILIYFSSSIALAVDRVDFNTHQECTVKLLTGYSSGTLLYNLDIWQLGDLPQKGDTVHNFWDYIDGERVEDPVTLYSFVDPSGSLFFHNAVTGESRSPFKYRVTSSRQTDEAGFTFDINGDSLFSPEAHLAFEVLDDRTLVHIYYGNLRDNLRDTYGEDGLTFECFQKE